MTEAKLLSAITPIFRDAFSDDAFVPIMSMTQLPQCAKK
jgi:hypothetical protein